MILLNRNIYDSNDITQSSLVNTKAEISLNKQENQQCLRGIIMSKYKCPKCGKPIGNKMYPTQSKGAMKRHLTWKKALGGHELPPGAAGDLADGEIGLK